MTLMKSLLLGSAAALVTVAAAQAADLPTKKGAPAAEYVRICHITANGTPITGFVLPGSDTCFKISGTVYAEYSVGSITDAFTYGAIQPTVANGGRVFGLTKTAATTLPEVGMYARGDITFEAVSNTAYGPLYSQIDLHADHGVGFDNAAASATQVNAAFITWAGITAGKHGSFFDFLNGGPAWDDILSPDHNGTPVELLAYTASFGGGISATLSLEQPEGGAFVGANKTSLVFNTTVLAVAPGGAGAVTANGMRAPDVVASLDVKQGWGAAHLAGVAHDVRLAGSATSSIDQWGWGVIGGLTFNLPTLGAGDDVRFQGAWTKEAPQYSGLFSPGYTGNTMNGNGVGVLVGDAAYLGGTNWSIPTAWSVAAMADINAGPTLKFQPVISYGEITWSNSPTLFSSKYTMWDGGLVSTWTPVKNLSFELDLLYGSGTQSMPSGWTAANTSTTAGWKSSSDGFNGRLLIYRSF